MQTRICKNLGRFHGDASTASRRSELDRRDSTVGPRLGRFNFVKYPLLVLGLAGLVGWVFIMSSEVQANLASIFSNPALVVVSCVAVLIIGAGTVIWQTRNGKNTMV